MTITLDALKNQAYFDRRARASVQTLQGVVQCIYGEIGSDAFSLYLICSEYPKGIKIRDCEAETILARG